MIEFATKPICSFMLPLPPGINGSYSVGTTQEGTSRIVATAALKKFKKDAVLLLNNQLQLIPREEAALLGYMIEKIKKYKLPLAVDMKVYLKDVWSMDEDACIKAAQDAVFKRLHINDNHAFDLHVRKRQDVSDPRCEIAIYLIEE